MMTPAHSVSKQEIHLNESLSTEETEPQEIETPFFLMFYQIRLANSAANTEDGILGIFLSLSTGLKYKWATMTLHLEEVS